MQRGSVESGRWFLGGREEELLACGSCSGETKRSVPSKFAVLGREGARGGSFRHMVGQCAHVPLTIH
jgi:hypothetical protein